MLMPACWVTFRLMLRLILASVISKYTMPPCSRKPSSSPMVKTCRAWHSLTKAEILSLSVLIKSKWHEPNCPSPLISRTDSILLLASLLLIRIKACWTVSSPSTHRLIEDLLSLNISAGHSVKRAKLSASKDLAVYSSSASAWAGVAAKHSTNAIKASHAGFRLRSETRIVN